MSLLYEYVTRKCHGNVIFFLQIMQRNDVKSFKTLSPRSSSSFSNFLCVAVLNQKLNSPISSTHLSIQCNRCMHTCITYRCSFQVSNTSSSLYYIPRTCELKINSEADHRFCTEPYDLS